MASNPVPLLKSLADTNPAKRDVEALRVFLELLREQIGGDAAPVDLTDAIDTNAAAIAVNASNISINTTNIATNASDISDLQAADIELDAQIYARITLRI